MAGKEEVRDAAPPPYFIRQLLVLLSLPTMQQAPAATRRGPIAASPTGGGGSLPLTPVRRDLRPVPRKISCNFAVLYGVQQWQRYKQLRRRERGGTSVKNRRRYRRASGYLPTTEIPAFTRDIEEVPAGKPIKDDSILLKVYAGSSDNDSNKSMDFGKLEPGENNSNLGSFHYLQKQTSSKSTEIRTVNFMINRQHSANPAAAPQLSSFQTFLALVGVIGFP